MKSLSLIVFLILLVVAQTKAQVTIYFDCDFGGQNQILKKAGRYNSSNLKLPNNSISSIKIENGYEVKLFDGEVFNNNNIVLTNSINCLTDKYFNDITSSLIVNKKETYSDINSNAPSNVEYEVVKDLSADEYQQKFNEFTKQNYRPTKVWANSSLTKNAALFNAKFVKNIYNLPFASFHGISIYQLETYISEYRNKGYALTYVDMDLILGNIIFCAVFTKVDNISSWTENHKLTEQAYQKYKAEKLAAGYKEYNNSKCMINGTMFYATSWYKLK